MAVEGDREATFRRTAHSGAKYSSPTEARGLANNGGVGLDLADQRGKRGADIWGHGHRQPGDPVEVPEQLGRGGLPVGAGDRDEGTGIRRQASSSSPASEAALPRGLHHRCVLGHSGALDQGPGLSYELGSIHLQADFDARLRQPFRPWGPPGVAAEDALTTPREQASDRRPRAGQPDHR